MISYDITKLKISEDLHSIFVVRNIQQGTVSKNYLYSIPFGNSVDFDDDNIEHSAEVGNQVYSLSTIGSGVIIVYNDDQCINIATFINSNFLATIDKFHQLDDTYQYSLMENHKIICLKQIQHDSVEFFVIHPRQQRISDSAFKITEFSNYRYNYPSIIMIKGGNEIIRYNFVKSKFTYVHLNSCFVALQPDSDRNMHYHGLLDIGKHFVKARLD